MYLFKNQLKSEDKEIIEKYLLNVFHESSAQSFTSLYMWRDIHDFCWQEIDGYLCIEGTYRPKQDEDLLLHYAFPPVPATGVYDILKLRNVCLKIKEIFEEAGETFLIKRLPLPLLPYFQRAFPEAKFVDDRNYYDYLYNLKELAELKGKRLHGKKNHVNYFNRTFDYDVKMYDPSMAEEVLDLVDRINEKRNDSSEDMAALSYERQGMGKLHLDLSAAAGEQGDNAFARELVHQKGDDGEGDNAIEQIRQLAAAGRIFAGKRHHRTENQRRRQQSDSPELFQNSALLMDTACTTPETIHHALFSTFSATSFAYVVTVPRRDLRAACF